MLIFDFGNSTTAIHGLASRDSRAERKIDNRFASERTSRARRPDGAKRTAFAGLRTRTAKPARRVSDRDAVNSPGSVSRMGKRV